MFAPNRYAELGPTTRASIDRLINALASSPDTAASTAATALAGANMVAHINIGCRKGTQ